MFSLLLRSLLVSIATSVDELPVLFLLYHHECRQKHAVTAAYLFGSLLLILLAALGSAGLSFLGNQALLGLMGLIPLYLGLGMLLRGEDEDNELQNALQAGQRWNRSFIRVLAISLAMGMDDLGVYIPLFSTQPWSATLRMAAVLLLTAAFYCLAALKLSSIRAFSEFLEKYERHLVGSLFILIGLWVLYQAGTLPWLAGKLP